MPRLNAIQRKLYEQARRRLAVTAGLLMGRKQVPRDFESCDEIARAVADTLTPREWRDLLDGALDPDAESALHDNIAYRLDDMAAWTIVRFFAAEGGIEALAPEEEVRLATALLHRLAERNDLSGTAELLWPSCEWVKAGMASLLGDERPVTLARLETALLAMADSCASELAERNTLISHGIIVN